LQLDRNGKSAREQPAEAGRTAETEQGFDDDQMTFPETGHMLDFVLEGLPFLDRGQSFRREYQGAGGGFSPTLGLFSHRSLSNRPGHLNALLEART